MEKCNGKLSFYGTLSDKEIGKWIERRQETADSRERALKQFEEDEHLAEKEARETTIVFGETVKQFLKRLEAIWR